MIDYTKDLLNPSQRGAALDIKPASIMSGGGKAFVGGIRGGGYVGVAFLPQRPIGGMMGRMGYGSKCAPVFKGELYQGGGDEKKEKKCNECEKSKIKSVSEIHELFMMNGGGDPGLITPFSAISAVSPMLAKMSMTNLISIILLIFAHSYIIQYGEKSTKSGKKKMLGG